MTTDRSGTAEDLRYIVGRFVGVCAESARALQELAVERHAAIGYGILTVETEEQAWARASVEQKNKGADAAKACLGMMNLRRRFGIR